MRMRIIFCVVAAVAFICGCDPEPSESLEQQNSCLRGQNAQLQSEKSQLAGQLSAARSEIAELRRALEASKSMCEKAQTELTGAKKTIDSQATQMKANDDAAKKKIKELEGISGVRPYWKWIAVCVGGIVLFVVGFLIVAGRRTPAIVANHEEDLPKCPRCGWKYTRGETKCRNCGTRF